MTRRPRIELPGQMSLFDVDENGDIVYRERHRAVYWPPREPCGCGDSRKSIYTAKEN